jgi:hypothetical protein
MCEILPQARFQVKRCHATVLSALGHLPAWNKKVAGKIKKLLTGQGFFYRIVLCDVKARVSISPGGQLLRQRNRNDI